MSSNPSDPNRGFFKNGLKIAEVINRLDYKGDDGKWLSLNPKSCRVIKKLAGTYFGEHLNNQEHGRGIGIDGDCYLIDFFKNGSYGPGNFFRIVINSYFRLGLRNSDSEEFGVTYLPNGYVV